MNKFSKMLMTDTFEVKGKWFLPEADSEQAVSGILRYSPYAITLELIGSFSSPIKLDEHGNCAPLRIYGYSEFDELFSLFDAYPAHVHEVYGRAGFSTVSYSITRFYVGRQFIKEQKEPLFDRLKFSFVNLDGWLDYPTTKDGFDFGNQKHFIDPNGSKGDRQSISIPSAHLNLCERISSKFVISKDFYLYEKRELMINRFYCLGGSDWKLFSTNELLEYAGKIRRLLALVTGNAMYFSYLDFILSNDEENPCCRMFFKQPGDILKAKHLDRKGSSFLIKRSDIKDTMSNIFDYWFREQEKLGECINAYISDQYIPTYMENEFLSVARGVESYHRFFAEKQSFEQIECGSLELERKQILAYIEENISEENKEYFSERIRYQDEMNFRKRLNNIFESVPSKLINRVFGELTSRKKKSIMNTILATRNYYTHRDQKEKYPNAVQSHSQLYDLTNQLSVLLQYLCLTQIGVNSEIVVQRLIERL